MPILENVLVFLDSLPQTERLSKIKKKVEVYEHRMVTVKISKNFETTSNTCLIFIGKFPYGDREFYREYYFDIYNRLWRK